MRQMAGDGQHQIVMLGVMISTSAPQRLPEGGELLDRLRRRCRRRRQDAPAAVEQLGKAGVGAGIFGAGDRMAGNEMHASRQMRSHVAHHRRLHRADVGDDRARLRGPGRSPGRCAPNEPTGDADDDEIGAGDRFGRIGMDRVTRASAAPPFAASPPCGDAPMPRSGARRAWRARRAAIDEPIRPACRRCASVSNSGLCHQRAAPLASMNDVERVDARRGFPPRCRWSGAARREGRSPQTRRKMSRRPMQECVGRMRRSAVFARWKMQQQEIRRTRRHRAMPSAPDLSVMPAQPVFVMLDGPLDMSAGRRARRCRPRSPGP